MVAHHAAHRESRNVNAILVDAVLVVHFVDDGFDEVQILVARNIPSLILAVREYNHKASGIGNRFPLGSVLLIRGILIHTVHLDNERSPFFDVLRCVHVHATGSPVHVNVICK